MVIWPPHRNMENSSISHENIEKTHALKLNFVCEIVPKKEKLGRIFEYDFQEDIERTTDLHFSQYGKGPFCCFSIPNGYSGKSGIYFIFENNALRYIGECTNLLTRFNLGYGIIEFRNCLHDGQQTNCRMNHLILEGIKNHSQFFLYFYETSDRKDFETRLISYYHPPWNRTQKQSPQPRPLPDKRINISQYHSEKRNPGGKYENLFNLLKTCKKKELVLTLPEIEALLGIALPPSAYKYRPWWANDDSHSQAKAWLNAEWKVVHVNLGKSVKFSTDFIKI
jgi:hypothetical protein